MAKYMRTSKHLQRICSTREFRHQHEVIICCFLHAFQESMSLKELNIHFPLIGEPSNLALKNMLTYTQSLRSLKLNCVAEEYIDVSAARSGLKKNTTLQELTLEVSEGTTLVSPILTSLLNHPLLRKLCLGGDVRDLEGLDALLLSDTSNITELDIHRYDASPRIIGLTRVLQALASRPTLTKLRLRRCPLGRDEAILLGMVLRNTPSLQSLILESNDLGSTKLAELAPALYHNTSLKVLDISVNNFNDTAPAAVLRDILRNKKTITTLNLSRNVFGLAIGAVECIVDGLGSNSTLLNIDLSLCCLGDKGVSTLARTHGSRNTALQNSLSVRIQLHLRALVRLSKEWSRAAPTSRISTSGTTKLSGTREQVP
jgi:hypothetical protein